MASSWRVFRDCQDPRVFLVSTENWERRGTKETQECTGSLDSQDSREPRVPLEFQDPREPRESLEQSLPKVSEDSQVCLVCTG